MVDVSHTCDVVAAQWKACSTEDALFSLDVFLRKRSYPTSTSLGLGLGEHGENGNNHDNVHDDDHEGGGGGGTTTGSRVGGIGGDVIEQLKLVQEALAEQVGGKDSDICKKAKKRADDVLSSLLQVNGGKKNEYKSKRQREGNCRGLL